MVTTPTAPAADEAGADAKAGAARHAQALGAAGGAIQLGELPALGAVGGQFAAGLRGVLEPLLRRQPKIAAEEPRVARFDEWAGARPAALSSLTLMAMPPLSGQALLAIDGALVFEMVDLFFGGAGAVPDPLPAEFTPTADAIVARIVAGVAECLGKAWREFAEIDFSPKRSVTNPAALTHLAAEELVLVTRFVASEPDSSGAAIEIVYPVSSLKPVAALLGPKVQAKRGGPDPLWMSSLTRAVMNVKLPVRSVLAEPVIPLAQLMSLRPGDIIPINLAPEIPLLVANNRFARGAVGAANGRAAIRLNRIERLEDEDEQ